jgi:hypothetical protein
MMTTAATSAYGQRQRRPRDGGGGPAEVAAAGPVPPGMSRPPVAPGMRTRDVSGSSRDVPATVSATGTAGPDGRGAAGTGSGGTDSGSRSEGGGGVSIVGL